jgi:hypothetical protein
MIAGDEDGVEEAWEALNQHFHQQLELTKFLARLRHRFEQKICCDRAAYRISSVGRGIELVLGDAAANLALDPAADPFALYVFGWSAHPRTLSR